MQQGSIEPAVPAEAPSREIADVSAARLDVDEGAKRLDRFLRASVELMLVMARACGNDSLVGFELRDLTPGSTKWPTWITPRRSVPESGPRHPT